MEFLFINLPNPHPLVPLRRGKGWDCELGVIHKNIGSIVYLVNLLDAQENGLDWLKQQPRIVYKSNREMHADGWVID
jgi:hypothetical protein